MSPDESDVHCMDNRPDVQVYDTEPPMPPVGAIENEVKFDDFPSYPGTDDGAADDDDIDTKKPPKGCSIAHFILNNKLCTFVSFDIETGGENCGIIQISAEVCRMTLISDGNKLGNDRINGAEREPEVFNKYVNPKKPEYLWDIHAKKAHGLLPTDPRILGADTIETWIWKLTQAPGSRCNMPPKLKFFLDPFRVIDGYTTCQINKKRSKMDSYELGVVWKFLDSEHNNLKGAHNSLVDAKAQTDILVHEAFVPFINHTKSIALVDDIFTATQQNEWRKKLEPVREVHAPWKEITKDQDVTWRPSWEDLYGGPHGGPKSGPSQYIIGKARAATSLSDIFFAIVPMTFFDTIARLTTKYCYKDWVVEKCGRDLNGNVKKRKYLVNCHEATEGARNRGDSQTQKFTITPGFIIAWIGILILNGAHSGAGQRTSRKYWRSPPHGLALPYVMNTMSRNAFEFLRHYIHFADNSKAKAKDEIGYDPLFKVSYPLEVMMGGMRQTWTAGKYITINESMIRYMGRAISYVQYMPAKPIKHGIKVYAACCGYSGVLLAFRVFTGNEDSSGFHNSTITICDTLIRQANLHEQRGRVLVTDNNYTTVALAKYLFVQYRWTLIGTIIPTEKKSREDEDIPFLKLSNGGLKEVDRGWYHEAVLCQQHREG
ncbi:hypothetical protein ACHAWU_003889 [Discostella pseudostelligera]|uniref:PiggyBac transposable element-derived protein domain-containing protein n=1 Tax=Discostella pseudostelligera TaxID=259834 RepID=A0ABD3M905_9STRA